MTTFHDQTSLLPPLHKERITCTRTPLGVLAHIPVMKISGSSGRELYLGELGWSIECEDEESGTARALLLLLPLDDDYQHPSSSPPAFATCVPYVDGMGIPRCVRWVISPNTALEQCFSGSWTWMDIHLLHCDRAGETVSPIIPLNYSYRSPFHFPDINIRSFMSNMKEMFSSNSLAVEDVDVPWSGFPPATFTFDGGILVPVLVIQVGLCSAHLRGVPGPSAGRHIPGHADLPLWARAIYTKSPGEVMGQHSCSTDHVDDWPDKQRCFKDGREYLWEIHTVLSFTSRPSKQPCQLKAWMGFRQDCHLCPIDHESGCACSQALPVPHDN